MPEEHHFHSVKTMLAKVYGSFNWNVSALVDYICKQKYIGNIITLENEGEGDVMGVNTIIPL